MGLRRQVHTVSRVPQAQACSLAPATAQAPQHIRLSADALFKFGRSDFDGMTALGVQALLELVEHIRSDFAAIERLHIVGHADPLGQRAANQTLAMARAATVRDYIERQNLPVQSLTAEGRGDREPVITHCERTVSVQSIACHQPNRRVVVEVVGERR
jgi:OmpA-OmpF porin, OOP family